MKQTALALSDLLLIVFAVFGVIWIIERLTRSSFAIQQAPVVNVTVNLPESKPKELTAGDHAKGLLKIGWNKTCETVMSPIGWVSGLFR